MGYWNRGRVQDIFGRPRTVETSIGLISVEELNRGNGEPVYNVAGLEPLDSSQSAILLNLLHADPSTVSII